VIAGDEKIANRNWLRPGLFNGSTCSRRCRSWGHGPFRGRGRLMLMSGSDASTFAAECGQAAASRLNEVVAITVPAGHRRPVNQVGKAFWWAQAVFVCPHSNEVPSTQMQWRMIAIFRAIATLAFFIPIRLASFNPQARREDHFFVR
jgi:hypothetical protein